MSTFDILYRYNQAIIDGLFITFQLAISIWFIGIFFGVIIGIILAKSPKYIGLPITVLGAVVTSIPILVLLFWMHYPLQVAFQVIIDPFYTAIFTLSIVNIFGVAFIVRGALADFPKQFINVAKVCGVNNLKIFRKIVLPLIVRQVLPGILLLQVIMLQSTLFASLISVDEIFRVAQRINAIVYRPIQIYTALAFLFILLCLPLNFLAYWLNKKFRTYLTDN